MPPPLRDLLLQGVGNTGAAGQHVFEAPDNSLIISLSREMLTIKTVRYGEWIEFRARLRAVKEVFEGIYRPTSYNRLDLRYVDVIRRSTLELANVAWSELLKPAIAGELTTQELGADVQSMTRDLHCGLGRNNQFLSLKTGIAKPKSQAQDREQCFLIDADFHTHSPTETNNAETIFDIFNRESGYLFRWSILPRLRAGLQPV